MLSPEELEEIRNRPKDLTAFHNVLIAQSDRARLLEYVDYLTQRLEEAEREKTRLRRSIT